MSYLAGVSGCQSLESSRILDVLNAWILSLQRLKKANLKKAVIMKLNNNSKLVLKLNKQ